VKIPPFLFAVVMNKVGKPTSTPHPLNLEGLNTLCADVQLLSQPSSAHRVHPAEHFYDIGTKFPI